MSTPRKRPDGWWYPYIFVGGFGIVVAVNGTMAYFAGSTFTGLETEKPYLKGLEYNETLKQAEAQKSLGWQMTAEASTAEGELADPNARPADLAVTLRDIEGQPISGADVLVSMHRPTQSGLDSEARLSYTGNGSYATTMALPAPGQWEMRVVAQRGEDRFELRKRVLIP